MRFGTMPWDKEFNPEKFREECTKAREENSRRSRESSDSGKTFEHQIETACMMYEESNKASVAKIPEPFRVIKKGFFQDINTSVMGSVINKNIF